jgi:DNA-binding YbaB/EbfC family protein
VVFPDFGGGDVPGLPGGIPGLGGGMPDMGAMFQQAMQMQEAMLAAQQELENTVVSGSAGNGLVVARCTGTGELVGLDIKPEAADPQDTETLADLVIVAVRDARAKADQLAEEKMGPLTGGLGGMAGGLGSLFGQ